GHSSTNGYRVGFTARELQTMVFPEPTFVVDGLITPGLTFLVSRPKLGKSWWALDVAIAIATGQPALGSATVEQGDVLCLALEDSARRLQRRMERMLGCEDWPERLTIFTKWPRGEEGLEGIREWVRSVEAPKLAIIDTYELFRTERSGQCNPYAEDYRV